MTASKQSKSAQVKAAIASVDAIQAAVELAASFEGKASKSKADAQAAGVQAFVLSGEYCAAQELEKSKGHMARRKVYCELLSERGIAKNQVRRLLDNGRKLAGGEKSKGFAKLCEGDLTAEGIRKGLAAASTDQLVLDSQNAIIKFFKVESKVDPLEKLAQKVAKLGAIGFSEDRDKYEAFLKEAEKAEDLASDIVADAAAARDLDAELANAA